MSLSQLLRTARRPVLPLVLGGVAVATLATCVIITLGVKKAYIGGIPYPYFSDTGREPPAYPVFASGLTLAALVWMVCLGVWFTWVRDLRTHAGAAFTAGATVAMWAGLVAGLIASVFLSLVAILDTINFASAHQLSAYSFFTFALVHVVCSVVISSLAKRQLGTEAAVRCHRAKIICATLLVIFVIIYLPVGLSLACGYNRLTVQDCLAKGLGQHYCEVEVRKNDTLTKLWDYSGCPGINTMRSVTQHLSVLSLLMFLVTYTLEFRLQIPAPELKPAGMELA